MYFENARVERGELVLGRVDIGAEASISSYSVLEGNTSVGFAAKLEGLSALADGQHIPDGEKWMGSPAAKVGAHDRSHLPPRPHLSRLRAAFETVFFSVASLSVALLFFMTLFPTFIVLD